MYLAEFQPITRMCEACDQVIAGKILAGLESDTFTTSPIHLCKNCGPIDLDLMQFCRELTIGSSEN